MKTEELKQTKYFLSYAFTMNTGKTGFGSTMITGDGKNDSMRDIEILQNDIAEVLNKELSGTSKVVILNYQIVE